VFSAPPPLLLRLQLSIPFEIGRLISPRLALKRRLAIICPTQLGRKRRGMLGPTAKMNHSIDKRCRINNLSTSMIALSQVLMKVFTYSSI